MGQQKSKDRLGKVQKTLNMTSDEANAILQQFFALTDNNRRLSRQKFYEIIKESHHGKAFDPNVWSSVFDMLDLNGDGEVDFYEFSISMVYTSKLSLDSKIDYLFNMMDFNKDGSVSLAEMNRAIATASAIAEDTERVWDLNQYFPTLANKDTLTKKEFKEALKGPKGAEILNLLSQSIEF